MVALLKCLSVMTRMIGLLDSCGELTILSHVAENTLLSFEPKIGLSIYSIGVISSTCITLEVLIGLAVETVMLLD